VTRRSTAPRLTRIGTKEFVDLDNDALQDAVAAFNPTEWINGKTTIRVRP